MVLVAGFLGVCPIQPHFLHSICLAAGFCPARSHRSSFRIFSYQIYKHLMNKLNIAKGAMERKMLNLKLQNKVSCLEIRKRTKTIDIIKYTLKQKWKWAGHNARMKDNRWTKPRRGKRSRGRPSRKWQDDIAEEGITWDSKALDRRQCKALMDGYILQWMGKAW